MHGFRVGNPARFGAFSSIGVAMDIFINAGQTSTGIAVEEDFTIEVLSGGTASSTDVANGTEIVFAGGVSVSAAIAAESFEIVSGGTDSDATVNGSQTISLGGTVVGATL